MNFRIGTTSFLWFAFLFSTASLSAAVDAAQVKRSLTNGMEFLKRQQKADGTWSPGSYPIGHTSLVALALATAGEPADSPTLSKALRYLRSARNYTQKTYEISLQTMALAVASPKLDSDLIRQNVDWLCKAQAADGTWDYQGIRGGDNSNTQFALLALYTADEAGIRIPPETFLRARKHWETTQNPDGGWGYSNYGTSSYGSMTAAGIASLVITGVKGKESLEILEDDEIKQCGKEAVNPTLEKAYRWMSTHFSVSKNPAGSGWLYYYLYALERAGRLMGLRFFGMHDWYVQGAEFLISKQNPDGSWAEGQENSLQGTSYAVLFLAKGKAPVLINKLVHGPQAGWRADPDDIRNLVDHMGRTWKQLLVWQVVDPEKQTLDALEQAPIAFLNGHKAPTLNAEAKERIRHYVDGGGFLFVDACCGSQEFDAGFRTLIKEIFPEEGSELKPLPEDHDVWRIRNQLDPSLHPLWGIQRACRTSVIYSPSDLSCYWNQLQKNPRHPTVKDSFQVGENIVAYATGDNPPPDKLSVKPIESEKETLPKRGTLQIAKIRHGGDWDLAPNAVPNLMRHLSSNHPVDVIVNQRGLFASDKNLVNYPLTYMQGRRDFKLSAEEVDGLKRHLMEGAGTLFADALCGSDTFDVGFKRLVEQIFPGEPLEPIPLSHELYNLPGAHNIESVTFNEKIDGKQRVGQPELFGVEHEKHWAIIYSKTDLGCALQKTPHVKGYTYESALDIACNIVHYSMLP